MAAIHSTDIRSGNGGLDEIRFASSAPIIIQKSFVLNNPPRLVLDIKRLSNGKGVRLPANYRGGLISGIRFGQYDGDTSRLVLDLAATELRYQIAEEGKQLRVTLKNDSPNTLPTRTAPAPKPTLAPRGTPVAFPLPVPKPEHLAKQATRPIIVIDAGHGGKDSGAVGKRGSLEKRITLDYALALRKALLQTGRYRVALTRDGDRYLFLKERVAVARKAQGDVFISLHADSNPRSDAKGLSVYTLSEKASDSEAAALARQENKADIIGGMDLSVEDAAVANILIYLAQRETNNKSERLAKTIIGAIEKRIPLITNPHRHAGFRVLKAPDIPSVLVEVGFLSNRTDEKRIQTAEHRTRVNQSIIKALDRFFETK
jgi:N-acetylmuramoyl-L-alanine amidase